MKFAEACDVTQIGRKSSPHGRAAVPREVAASAEERGPGVITGNSSSVMWLFSYRADRGYGDGVELENKGFPLFLCCRVSYCPGV